MRFLCYVGGVYGDAVALDLKISLLILYMFDIPDFQYVYEGRVV